MQMYKAVRLFVMGAAAVAGTGCELYRNTAADALTVQETHPITVDSQVVTLTLAPQAGGELSALDAAKIRAFALDYMNKGHGPVSLTSPARPSRAAEAFMGRIDDVFQQVGLPQGTAQRTSYARSAGADDAYILSYTHYVATPSACGVWRDRRTRDYKNLRTPNFGCATQNNLAAMVIDPHDLVAPADMTSPDAAIRIRGVRAFRLGEDTATQKSADIEAKVSE